jgi:hypothetical protein
VVQKPKNCASRGTKSGKPATGKPVSRLIEKRFRDREGWREETQMPFTRWEESISSLHWTPAAAPPSPLIFQPLGRRRTIP